VWLPDGHRIFLIGEDSTGHVRGYVQDMTGGLPQLVTGSFDFTAGFARLTPDGRYFTVAPIRRLFSLTGAAPIEIPGIASGEKLFCAGFSRDGREVIAGTMGSPRPEIVAIDLRTGARRVLGSIGPLNSAGVIFTPYADISDDGKTCAFSVDRNLSEIYVAEGLR